MLIIYTDRRPGSPKSDQEKKSVCSYCRGRNQGKLLQAQEEEATSHLYANQE